MCGIVGIATQRAGVTAESVVLMRDAVQHRGPDDCGVWVSQDRRVGLGHRRLAIIDLSPAGRQPMSLGDRLQIVFNGEIYNYRELREQLERRGHAFSTHTDTEVILAGYAEWGRDVLDHLVGMFAFALHDARHGKVLLARDRAGEKPLFFSHRNGRLVFGSELKSLMADDLLPRRVDLAALDQFLAYGYVLGGSCMLEGVRKLKPAHAVEYDVARDTLSEWRYWSLPEPSQAGSADIEGLSEELHELLGRAVQSQLVADVPLGILLSGGLDSSIVATLAAARSSDPIRTFTVRFPGHGDFDEGPYAKLVAEHLGARHTEMAAEPATVDLLPILARQYDEPLGDSSMVPTYLVSKLIREHCTVALGGDGGDELFAGYKLHQVAQAQNLAHRMVPKPMRELIHHLAARRPVGTYGRTYAMNLRLPQKAAIASTGLFLDRTTRENLAPILRTLSDRAEDHKLGFISENGTTLQKVTSTDFQTYLPDDILVKVDRASMLNSLEVRAPFLDRDVVEFAFGRVPDRLRGTVRLRKVLLRHLGRKILPKALDLTRKQGFSIPLHSWFKGAWGDALCDILTSSDSGVFDRRYVDGLIASQRAGLSNSQRLFSLAMFELWRREYGVQPPLASGRLAA